MDDGWLVTDDSNETKEMLGSKRVGVGDVMVQSREDREQELGTQRARLTSACSESSDNDRSTSKQRMKLDIC